VKKRQHNFSKLLVTLRCVSWYILICLIDIENVSFKLQVQGL